jgi:hypothetical protein
MAGMDGLGRLFNSVPIAAGVGLAMRDCSAYTFVCTGNDTFTITVASTFAGSYATPGSIITRVYTNTATNGTAAWVKASQAAANTVVIASGSVAFTVFGSQLPDPKCYVKVSASSAGLVQALAHDLTVQRGPANLAKLSA